MHEPFTEELITARFTFHPERASEFLEDEGRLVTQMEFETVDEIMECIEEFKDALVDVNAIINGQVINLVDFPADEEEG